MHNKLRREKEAKEKIPLDAKRSRNVMQLLVRITQKEENKNNNATLQLIKEYAKRIQKEDMKNSNVIQLPADDFIKIIQKGDTKNSNVILLLTAKSVKEILNVAGP